MPGSRFVLVSAGLNCRKYGGSAARAPASVELVLENLTAERISMNSQHYGRTRLIALDAVEHTLDEAFFKFSDRFIKQNPVFHHLRNEPFQLILHVCALQRCISLSPGPSFN